MTVRWTASPWPSPAASTYSPPGHLIGVDGRGLHGGELNSFTGEVGAGEVVATGEDDLEKIGFLFNTIVQ